MKFPDLLVLYNLNWKQYYWLCYDARTERWSPPPFSLLSDRLYMGILDLCRTDRMPTRKPSLWWVHLGGTHSQEPFQCSMKSYPLPYLVKLQKMPAIFCSASMRFAKLSQLVHLSGKAMWGKIARNRCCNEGHDRGRPTKAVTAVD